MSTLPPVFLEEIFDKADKQIHHNCHPKPTYITQKSLTDPSNQRTGSSSRAHSPLFASLAHRRFSSFACNRAWAIIQFTATIGRPVPPPPPPSPIPLRKAVSRVPVVVDSYRGRDN